MANSNNEISPELTRQMRQSPRNMRELCAALGLSRATVSYVLNNSWAKHKISEQTATRVREYAKAVNFIPNPNSLALRGKLTTDIAILTGRTRGYWHKQRAFFDLLNAIKGSNMRFMVMELQPENYLSTLRELRLRAVKKVVVLSDLFGIPGEVWPEIVSNSPESRWLFYDIRFNESIARQLLLRRPDITLLQIDRARSWGECLDLVLQEGRPRIYTIIPGVCSLFADKISKLSNPPEMVLLPIEGEDPSDPSVLCRVGTRIGEAMLSHHRPGLKASAFVPDDLTTAGILAVLLRNKVRVPEDISILSWDGLPESDYFSLPLTTAQFPYDELIKHATEWIFDDEKPGGVFDFYPQIRQGKTFMLK